MSTMERAAYAKLNELGLAGRTQAAPDQSTQAAAAAALARTFGKSGRRYAQNEDWENPTVRAIHAEAAQKMRDAQAITQAREFIERSGGKPENLSDYEAVVGAIEQERYPQGVMQDQAPVPLTGLGAFGAQAARGIIGPFAETAGGALSGISPRVEPVAQAMLGFNDSMPPAEGGGALAGDIAGAAGQVAVMAFTGGAGMVPVVGSFGISTARESLANDQVGGYAGGALASARAAAEVVPEFIAIEKFVGPIARGIVSRASARMAERGVGRAALGFGGDLAAMGAVEGSEELVTLTANLSLDVMKGDLTIDEAAKAWASEAPRTFGVAFAGTALAGGIGGGVGAMTSRRGGQGAAGSQLQPASATAPQQAAGSPTGSGTPDQIRVAAGQATSPTQTEDRRFVLPQFASEEELAKLAGKRIDVGLPIPDLMVSGTPMFWDPADAQALVKFRNDRMIPGDDPVTVVQVLPEGESEPYYAVRPIRPIPSEQLGEGGPQEARLAEAADLAAQTAAVQRMVNRARVAALKSDRAEARSLMEEFRARSSAQAAEGREVQTEPQTASDQTRPPESPGRAEASASSERVESQPPSQPRRAESGSQGQAERRGRESSPDDTEYPTYYGDLLVAPSVKPFEGELPDDEWRGDAIMDWYQGALDALAEDNPPEPDFSRAHEGLNAVRELLTEGDREGAARLWDELTYHGPALFDVTRVSPETVQAMREEQAQEPIQVGDRVSVPVGAHVDAGPRDIAAQGVVKKVGADGQITVRIGSSNMKFDRNKVKLVQAAQAEDRSEAGTPKRSKSSDRAGRPSRQTAGSDSAVGTQEAEPKSQRSETGPASEDTTRTSEPSYTEGPSITKRDMGERDSLTKRIITQGFDGVQEEGRLKLGVQLAGLNKPALDSLLSDATAEIGGLEFNASRVKLLDRLVVKEADGKPAHTISDYLAARILVDRLGSVEELKQAIEARGFRIIEDDDFLETGREKKGGHRARNLQVVIGDGFSAEIQLVTRETYDVRKQTHAAYEKMREPGVSEAEYEKWKAEAIRINNEAWSRFLAHQEAEDAKAEDRAVDAASEDGLRALAGTPATGPPAAGGAGQRAAGDGGDRGAGGADADAADSERDTPRRGPGDGLAGAHPHPTNTSAAGGAGRPGVNYRITTDDKLGIGGPKAKYQANIEAIRTLKAVEREGRRATPDEQRILARYIGWGPLKQVFSTRGDQQKGWGDAIREVRELLTEDEHAAAQASVLNAHYTAEGVVKGMWEGLKRAKFRGGTVLEPAAGIGYFFGLMPDEIAANSRMKGVELDSISARIAAQLYQNADIVRGGFETVNLPEGSVDLVITNVPFGRIPVTDKHDLSLTRRRLSLHNYFIAKSLKALRPGGVAAIVTTHFTMDAGDRSARVLFDSMADLVGAVRLNNKAFMGNASTPVVTDLLVFQKRAPGAARRGMDFLDAKVERLTDRSGTTAEARINQVFLEDGGGLVVGHHAFSGSMRQENEYTVEADDPKARDASIQAELRKAISEHIAKSGIDKKALETGAQVDFNEREEVGAGPVIEGVRAELDAAGVKENALAVREGVVYQRKGDTLVPTPLPGGEKSQAAFAQRVEGMNRVRDAMNTLLRLQIDPEAPDAAVESARKVLNKHYDAFTKERPVREKRDKKGNVVLGRDGKPKTSKGTAFGAINNPMNNRYFDPDPDWSRLLALEHWDEDTKTATKADIFRERTQRPPTVATSVDSAQAALRESLNQRGGVDMDFMLELSSLDQEKIVEELGDAVFRNPTGGWEPGSQYLSGDVVTKLDQARAAARQDEQYRRNVAALEKIQPAPVEPGNIRVQMGSAWVPHGVYADFFRHITGREAVFHYVQSEGTWVAESSNVGYDTNLEESEWGVVDKKATTADGSGPYEIRKPAGVLLVLAMNNQDTSAKKTIKHADGSSETLRFPETTSAINAKVKALKAEFERWLWEDSDRVDQLTSIYNDRFNRHVFPEYDGSHLTLPGAALEGKTIHKHVRSGIYRIITTGNTLLAHVVGAGKTWTMCGACMEMKRLGLAKKPIIVVPNHLVAQWGREFLQLYPNANLLVASTKDFTPQKRGVLMSKIATGNWDAIIVPQTSFTRLPVSPERIKAFFTGEIAKLEAEIRTAKRAKDQENRNFVAELEASKKRLEAMLEKQLAEWNKDADFIPFDQLGIDAMFVDEAHDYKNLWFRTKQSRVPGISAQVTQRPFDMFLKTQYLNEATGGRGVIFATGTPIANSVTEAYTMQRYLQPGLLREQGIEAFDAWASTFGRTETELEISPEGGKFRMHTRFSRFNNLPALKRVIRQVFDVVDQKKANIKVPPVKGGKAQIIDVPPSPFLERFVKSLGDRAEAIRNGEVTPDQDNMLAVTNDGRKATTDLRLLDPALPDLAHSKINTCVSKVHEIWKREKKHKGVQIVWLDMGVPKVDAKKKAKADEDDIDYGDDEAQQVGKIDLYADMKAKLVKMGIPADQVAFIHDAKNSDAAKAKLFEDVRSGKIRVLVGNTQRMGTGANIQLRLAAAHHLDAPWRPADVEQRDGRIIRWGNIYADLGGVEIYRYVTKMKGSFDGYMWQTLERKATFIAQLMSDDMETVEMEDIGRTALSYAEIKAIASGDPTVMEFVQSQAALQELEAEHSNFIRTKASAAQSIGRLERQAAGEIERAERAEAIAKRVDPEAGFVVGGVAYDNRTDATGPLGEIMQEHQEDIALAGEKGAYPTRALGTIHGIEVELRVSPFGRAEAHEKETGLLLTDIQDSDVGNVTRILNAFGRLNDWAANRREEAETATRRAEGYRAIAGKSFDKTKELEDLRARVSALEAKLAASAAPPASPKPLSPTGEAIRRLEQLIETIEARQVERRTTLLYSGINPREVSDLALWVGAHIARGVIKGYRQARRLLIGRFGERVRDDSDKIVRRGLKIGQKIVDAQNEPPGATERVQATLKAAGPRGPSTTANIPEKAVTAAAFRAGLNTIRAQLPGLVKEAKEAERTKAADRQRVVEGVRDELIRLIENHLPNPRRGRFLKRANSIKTYNDLARAVDSIRRERARYLGTVGMKSIRRWTRAKKLARLTNARRHDLSNLRRDADALYETLKGKNKTVELEHAARTIDELRERVLETFAEHQAENRKLRLAKGLTRRVVVARATAEAKRSRAELPDSTGERQDLAAPWWRRAGMQMADLENITSGLAGDWEGGGTLYRVLFDGLSDAHEDHASEMRDRFRDLEAMAKKAGYGGINDLIERTSRRGGRAKTVYFEVLLGGRRVKITLGNAMKLAALDEETRGMIRAGNPIKLKGGTLRTSITPTLREIDAITEQIGMELFAVVEEGKLIREAMRPRAFESHRRLKGYEPPLVEGYEPRKRWRAGREAKFGIEDVKTKGSRYIENLGFTKARVEDRRNPIVIGDFVEDLVESITNSSKLIHLAEPVRDAAGIVTDEKLQSEIASRFGRGAPRALEDYIVAASLVNEASPSTSGRAVQTLNRWTAASKLGLNPGTWLRQLGGIPRLAAEMSPKAFADGMKGAWKIKASDLLDNSGYFWDRMVGNVAGRFSPTVASDLSSVTTPRFLAAVDAATKNIVEGDLRAALRQFHQASMSTLEILVAFDAVLGKVAWAGYMAEAERQGIAEDQRTAWVNKRASLAIRHTQNSSSVLDMPLVGVRGRDNLAGLLLLFTSDVFKARNRLYRAAHQGRKAFAAHAAGEAGNIAWSVAVGVGVQFAVRSLVAAMGGDDDDWEKIRADALAFDKHLLRLARESVAVGLDPVLTPRVIDWFSYRNASVTDVPLTSSIRDAEDALKSAIELVRSGKALDDPKSMLFATDALVRDTLALFGLNPLQSLWRTASKQFERQRGGESRAATRSRSDERRSR